MAIDQVLYKALVGDGLPPRAALRIAGLLGALGATASSAPDAVLGAGSGQAGALVVHKAVFDYSLPGLATGAAVTFNDGYIPAVGDLLMNAWFEVLTPFDGVTPTADIGPFEAGRGGRGLFGWAINAGTPVDSNSALGAGYVPNLSLLAIPDLLSASVLGEAQDSVTSTVSNELVFTDPNTGALIGGNFEPAVPSRFITTDPILVCVSQNGRTTGGDSASTVGEAALYLVTCSPT